MLDKWIARWNDEGFRRDLELMKAHGVDSPELGWLLLPTLQELHLATIRTYTNRKVRLHAPDPDDLTMEDVCHHLALENRWNGATIAPFPVAQHSVWCLEVLIEMWTQMAPSFNLEWPEPPRQDKATMLWHDAPEAYLKDFPKGLKRLFQVLYDLLDARFWAAMVKKWPILRPEGKTPILEAVDSLSAGTEMRDLFLVPRITGQPTHPRQLVPMPWDVAERAMKDAAHTLLLEIP